jgi:hypothetical protein
MALDVCPSDVPSRRLVSLPPTGLHERLVNAQDAIFLDGLYATLLREVHAAGGVLGTTSSQRSLVIPSACGLLRVALVSGPLVAPDDPRCDPRTVGPSPPSELGPPSTPCTSFVDPTRDRSLAALSLLVLQRHRQRGAVPLCYE